MCEQFCFCHLADDSLKTEIAAEMMRVSRRYFLIHDWRAGSQTRQLYGVSLAKVRRWFPGWMIGLRVPSPVWPPIGRPLSRYAHGLYGLSRMMPFLVGSRCILLERPDVIDAHAS